MAKIVIECKEKEAIHILFKIADAVQEMKFNSMKDASYWQRKEDYNKADFFIEQMTMYKEIYKIITENANIELN